MVEIYWSLWSWKRAMVKSSPHPFGFWSSLLQQTILPMTQIRLSAAPLFPLSQSQTQTLLKSHSLPHEILAELSVPAGQLEQKYLFTKHWLRFSSPPHPWTLTQPQAEQAHSPSLKAPLGNRPTSGKAFTGLPSILPPCSPSFPTPGLSSLRRKAPLT